MLIVDKNELKKYYADQRLWQGIPGIEVTKNGRIFSAFYSGGSDEETGNFVVLLKSDNGVDFSEPIAVVYKENYRCYDECIWIDPLDRLWLLWSVMPDNAVYAAICDNPDADELVWGKEFLIGHDVMMNKPTVLSTGEWLFPIAVWGERVWTWMPERRTKQADMRAFVYKTEDYGKTFEKLGGVDMPERAYDEHMILELNDGRLMMMVRTMYGFGVSYSYDRGKTWTEGTESSFGGANSRAFISRLKSGRILLINHHNNMGRNNLTAMLSDDECKTWKYKLLIDERNNISYPDAKEAEDGFIYVTYDRERASGAKNMDNVYNSAREILFAKITEEDIMAGELVNHESRLKCVISKLGEYKGEEYNFKDKPRFGELVPYFAKGSNEETIEKLFKYFYREIKPDLAADEHLKLDKLVEELERTEDKNVTVRELVKLLYNSKRGDQKDVAELTRMVITENLDSVLSEEEIAKRLGISKHYLCHRFKMQTGITVEEYRRVLKNNYCKRMK